MNDPRALLVAICCWLSLLVRVCPGAEQPAVELASPLAPEQALESFELAAGLEMNLVAAEPTVIDPVAIRFDEEGRLWVVEMRDYPHGPPPGEPPQSRIRILEDRDEDGYYESAHTFADQLLFVTGLQPWKGGAFVTLAGRIDYMSDTDGDLRADRIETWYRGFAEENPQLRANHPRLGLDGYIYVANGLRGGSIVDPRKPGQEKLSISGMDFRFHPISGEFEAVTGMGQFGLSFDSFGERFVCSNRNPLIHVVLEDRYLKRSPHVAIATAVHDVAAAGAESRVYPLTEAWTTSTLHAGQFTAACGLCIYRGQGLPEQYQDCGFTCEPTGNLVHCEKLQPLGATFQSKPLREGAELLASRDPWFRPVNLEIGPDGALYVVDMYRAVIEHPQFMPEELKNRPDLRDGDRHGRIYRITSTAASTAARPRLSSVSNAELVGLLEHPYAWWRETAFRLLLERQDPGAVAKLKSILARQGKSAASRVAALWLLENLQEAEPAHILTALEDKDPRVREEAVAVAERYLSGAPALKQAVRQSALDSNARVRFQVALSLTPASAEDLPAIEEVAVRGVQDRWTREAVALAAGKHSADLLVGLLSRSDWLEQPASQDQLLLTQRLAELAGRGAEKETTIKLLAAIMPLQEQLRLQVVVVESLAGGVGDLPAFMAQQAGKQFEQSLSDLVKRASEVAKDPQQPPRMRIDAIRLLGLDPASESRLTQLATGAGQQSVRHAALEALARKSSVDPWRRLIDGFAQESPTTRRAILDGLFARPERVRLLLDAIESEQIRAAELDLTHKDRLTKYHDAQLRQRAKDLLADAVPEDRQQVLKRYQDVLEITGDPEQGREIFRRNCANCHRIGDIGIDVAPDIADSRVKTREQLLTDILQPNRAIDNNYISYTVITMDGRLLTGILVSETSSSISLKQPEGKQINLLRSEIEQLRSNGISLMPEGLEKEIAPQQMADLIAFIKNWRYLE